MVLIGVMGGVSAATTDQPGVSQNYALLFSKGQKTRNFDDGCVTAYQRDGLLYLVTHSKFPGAKVSVYDSRFGIFAEVPFGTLDKNIDCETIDLNTVKLSQVAGLNYISSQKFKRLFDNASQDPAALKNAITAGPVYFRTDGNYDGERSAFNILQPKILNIKSLDDVAHYLQNINADRAEQIIGPRARDLARVDNERDKQVQRQQEGQRLWNERLSATLHVGDKVCTYKNNWFGYVEDSKNNKIKIHVIGQVTSMSGAPGYFFKGNAGRFEYTPIESIRWVERDELAPCAFD